MSHWFLSGVLPSEIFYAIFTLLVKLVVFTSSGFLSLEAGDKSVSEGVLRLHETPEIL